MTILSIDTSCDETAVAVTKGRRILSNEIYSQILIHKKWGGVVPHLAKRAHEERIDLVIETAIKKAIRSAGPVPPFPPMLNFQQSPLRLGVPQGVPPASISSLPFLIRSIDYIAVTYGPGLAPALEVGIRKAKELAMKYKKKLIGVNHMEGHIYSCFAQNSKGNPKREFEFPYLALLVSGGHAELVLVKDHLKYQIVGETVDDAAGEALDKAAKMMGLGYPGGPVIEQLAKKGNKDYRKFPRPLFRSKDLNFSFSGLKTSLYYFYKSLKEEDRLNNLNNIAASYQEAVFDSLLKKLDSAANTFKIKNFLVAGGVAANLYFRSRLRKLIKSKNGKILFPTSNDLFTDNAAMIGLVAFYKAKNGFFVDDVSKLDRQPRAALT